MKKIVFNKRKILSVLGNTAVADSFNSLVGRKLNS
jgi:hypothetical protein